MLSLEFTGGEVLTPQGLVRETLALSEGRITDAAQPRRVDASGFRLLPGIVDLHGDGFERHVAPRRGAMKDVADGLRAAEAEMAANGITTGIVAQFISWEGGLRGFDFADQIFTTLRDVSTLTDLIPQVRFETHLLDVYATLPGKLREWRVPYIVFNDHLPHARLADGRRPKQLTGQALKAGRSPESHLELMQALHARAAEVPAALDHLCGELREAGIRMGSHDDATETARQTWHARGAKIAEFPETLDAVDAPGSVIMGAPNLVRGGSHKGNISALDVVLMGACDALASDYHYPSPRRAALFLARTIGPAEAWRLISTGPAGVLGLSDRGQLAPGLRADIVLLDAQDRVAGTLVAGRVSYMTGELAERFLGANLRATA